MNTSARGYLCTGLEATPIVIRRLLQPEPAAALDRRPDPDRFTIREVVAHLADWDAIFVERVRRILAEDSPNLPGYDEWQMGIEHDYASSNVRERLKVFGGRRAEMVLLLRELDDAAWGRRGVHAQAGELTVADIAAFVLGHDGYHLRQIVEWSEL